MFNKNAIEETKHSVRVLFVRISASAFRECMQGRFNCSVARSS
jgi:hypothetical protein